MYFSGYRDLSFPSADSMLIYPHLNICFCESDWCIVRLILLCSYTSSMLLYILYGVQLRGHDSITYLLFLSQLALPGRWYSQYSGRVAWCFLANGAHKTWSSTNKHGCSGVVLLSTFRAIVLFGCLGLRLATLLHLRGICKPLMRWNLALNFGFLPHIFLFLRFGAISVSGLFVLPGSLHNRASYVSALEIAFWPMVGAQTCLRRASI